MNTRVKREFNSMMEIIGIDLEEGEVTVEGDHSVAIHPYLLPGNLLGHLSIQMDLLKNSLFRKS